MGELGLMKKYCSPNRIGERSGPRLLSLLFILVLCWATSCTRSTQPGSRDGRIFIKLDLSSRSWPYSRKGYLKIVIEIQGWDPIEKFIFPLEYSESEQLIKELGIKGEDILNWNYIQGISTDLTGKLIGSGKGVKVTLNEMVPSLLRNASVTFRIGGNVILEVYFANLENQHCPLSIRRI